MTRYLLDFEYREGDEEIVLIWDNPQNEYEYESEFVTVKELLDYLQEYSDEIKNIHESVNRMRKTILSIPMPKNGD